MTVTPVGFNAMDLLSPDTDPEAPASGFDLLLSGARPAEPDTHARTTNDREPAVATRNEAEPEATTEPTTEPIGTDAPDEAAAPAKLEHAADLSGLLAVLAALAWPPPAPAPAPVAVPAPSETATAGDAPAPEGGTAPAAVPVDPALLAPGVLTDAAAAAVTDLVNAETAPAPRAAAAPAPTAPAPAPAAPVLDRALAPAPTPVPAAAATPTPPPTPAPATTATAPAPDNTPTAEITVVAQPAAPPLPPTPAAPTKPAAPVSTAPTTTPAAAPTATPHPTPTATPAAPVAAPVLAPVAGAETPRTDEQAPPTARVTAPATAPTAAGSPGPAPAVITAGTVATGDTAPAPAAPPPAADQLVSVLKPLRTSPAGTYTLRLELKPAELGRVEMRVEMKDGVLHASIHADREGSAQLLRDSLSSLRDRLEAEGVHTGELTISDGGVGSRRHDGSDARSSADPSATVISTTETPLAAIVSDPDSTSLLDVRI